MVWCLILQTSLVWLFVSVSKHSLGCLRAVCCWKFSATGCTGGRIHMEGVYECVTWPKVITSSREEGRPGLELRNKLSSVGLKNAFVNSDKPCGHLVLFNNRHQCSGCGQCFWVVFYLFRVTISFDGFNVCVRSDAGAQMLYLETVRHCGYLFSTVVCDALG